MNCFNHADELAEYYCVSCGTYFCQDCIKELKIDGTPIYTCLKCKGRCKSIKEWKELDESRAESALARDFWAQLIGVFKFPFNGEGPFVLLKGTIGFTVATFPYFLMKMFPSRMTAVFVGVLAPFVFFGAAACFLGTLERIAISDSDEPPELPDLFMIEDWIGKTFIFMIAAGLCLIPSLSYFEYTNKQDLFFWLLLSLGLYFLPMFMLYVSLGERFSFLNPAKSLASILNNWAAYSVIPLLWLILIFVGQKLSQAFSIERFSIFGFIGNCFLFVYFLYVSMRPLGVFYRAYEDRLVGFDSDTD